MSILATDRLSLRELTLDDAAFALTLLNDPDYITFIVDRGVRDLAAARAYLEAGPLTSYQTNGFGLWAVSRKTDGQLAGMCGLIKRDTLDDVDIGYAFLPAYRGQGFASEAAAACLAYGLTTLGLPRIVAVTTSDNNRSIRLLEKLGLRYERMVRLTPDDIAIKLFAINR